MRYSAVVAGLLFSALLVPFAAPREARADTAFSPQSVFARAEANNIDDRCSDARDFAKRAAKGTAEIDAQAAVDAEHGFIQCYALKRLNPDPEDMRYLILAAATSAYVAATKADPESAVTLYHQADDFADALGAEAPDRPWRAVEVKMGTPSARGGPQERNGSSGPTHYVEDVRRDVFGKSHPGKYSDVATHLREAITKSLADLLAAPGPDTSLHPTPAPSLRP